MSINTPENLDENADLGDMTVVAGTEFTLDGKQLTLQRDLHVVFSMDEGLIKASAPELGMLQSGFGHTQDEALAGLIDTIDSNQTFLTESGTPTVDYAAFVADNVRGLLSRA